MIAGAFRFPAPEQGAQATKKPLALHGCLLESSGLQEDGWQAWSHVLKKDKSHRTQEDGKSSVVVL
jgi:hypothetical protein